MNYKDIQGWFSEEGFYSRMVAEAPDPAVFVEVGCWLGKSTAYLAHEIRASGKNIQLWCVDTWAGAHNEPDQVKAAAEQDLLAKFLENMAACGFNFKPGTFNNQHSTPNIEVSKSATERSALNVERSMFSCHRADSVASAAQFPDGSLDFVFIDACHTYEAVRADIAAWKPKLRTPNSALRPAGVLAGHDWCVYEGVRRAVKEAFGANFKTEGNVWVAGKEKEQR